MCYISLLKVVFYLFMMNFGYCFSYITKKRRKKKQSFNWTVQLVLELYFTRIFELPCTEYKCFARRFVLDIVIYRSFHHIKHVQIEGIYSKNVYTWLIQYIILVSTVRGCFVFILFPSSQIEIENTYSHICNIIMNYIFLDSTINTHVIIFIRYIWEHNNEKCLWKYIYKYQVIIIHAVKRSKFK